jgi:hypothetical protein
MQISNLPRLFCYAIFVLLALTNQTQAEIKELLDYVVWAGTIEYREPPERLALESSATGVVGSQRKPVELLRASREVPAHLGVNFGIRFALPGERTTPARFDVVWHLPRPGLTSTTGERRTVSGYSAAGFCRKASPCGAAYSFDTEEELLVGEWIVEVILDDEVVVRKSFVIVPG